MTSKQKDAVFVHMMQAPQTGKIAVIMSSKQTHKSSFGWRCSYDIIKGILMNTVIDVQDMQD
jgi:hypothetical protein